MRWQHKPPSWRKVFAILPVRIGDNWLWLEWYERRFMCEYYEVREWKN